MQPSDQLLPLRRAPLRLLKPALPLTRSDSPATARSVPRQMEYPMHKSAEADWPSCCPRFRLADFARTSLQNVPAPLAVQASTNRDRQRPSPVLSPQADRRSFLPTHRCSSHGGWRSESVTLSASPDRPYSDSDKPLPLPLCESCCGTPGILSVCETVCDSFPLSQPSVREESLHPRARRALYRQSARQVVRLHPCCAASTGSPSHRQSAPVPASPRESKRRSVQPARQCRSP